MEHKDNIKPIGLILASMKYIKKYKYTRTTGVQTNCISEGCHISESVFGYEWKNTLQSP